MAPKLAKWVAGCETRAQTSPQSILGGPSNVPVLDDDDANPTNFPLSFHRKGTCPMSNEERNPHAVHNSNERAFLASYTDEQAAGLTSASKSTSVTEISTERDENAKSAHSLSHSGALWTPFFHRRPFLLGYLVTIITIQVALAVLFWYSQKNHGLQQVQNKLQYLWTYGPTAGKSHAYSYRIHH